MPAVSPSKWIRTEKPFPLPTHVRETLQILEKAGFVAYVVGGSVRDFLLNKPVKDHDIATNANPDETLRLFPDSITVGKNFGVLKVPIADTIVEIATFREDLEYKNHRHPSKIKFAGPTEDARRRDFTINALFYDPKTSRILDSTGGIDDLKAGIVRAIGDPEERFREDALRLLRAVRFATRFNFILDPATAEAIKLRAKLIAKVSPERIREELSLMWAGPRPSESLELLNRLGLLSFVLPELEKNKAGLAQTLRVMAKLSEQNAVRSMTLSWATVLMGTVHPGKSEEQAPSQVVGPICERLKMSRNECDQIVAIVSDHQKFGEVFKMRESTLQRFMGAPHFEDMLVLHKAEATVSDGNLAFYEFCASRLQASRAALPQETKLIDGKDLIQLGLSPGPGFTEILRTIEDLAMEKRLHTKEEALEYVVKHFVR